MRFCIFFCTYFFCWTLWSETKNTTLNLCPSLEVKGEKGTMSDICLLLSDVPLAWLSCRLTEEKCHCFPLSAHKRI